MILELLQARRSIRRFKPDMPERGLIERLIEAAVAAPSASNRQPWRFLIVADPEVVARLAEAVRAAVARVTGHVPSALQQDFLAYGDYFTRFEEAPIVIVPLCRRMATLSNLVDDGLGVGDRECIAAMETDSGLISASMAVQNLLLMAHASGLGASCMTGPLLAVHEVREILRVPDAWKVVAFVPVGFGAEDPDPKTRRPASSVVRWIQ